LAEKHPYSPGGAGAIAAAVTQFRNALPPKINAETLKKLGIAPNNESYVINILRFLGVIDSEGTKTANAASAFSKDDEEFQKEFGAMIEAAYSELFNLYHEKTWDLPENRLLSFFRTTDQTSAITGKRQALTFQTLASFAGHGKAPEPKAKQPKQTKEVKPPKREKSARELVETPVTLPDSGNPGQETRAFGLTVRVEVNLPPAGDQETYDKIFRSIRENLLNAK
jgi:hypothetical protein